MSRNASPAALSTAKFTSDQVRRIRKFFAKVTQYKGLRLLGTTLCTIDRATMFGIRPKELERIVKALERAENEAG